MARFVILGRYIAMLIGVSLLGGCVAMQQYRTGFSMCSIGHDSACEKSALQQWSVKDGSDYWMGYVEFDDQGQLWDRNQMIAVTEKLEMEAGEKDLLMVVFVHGWKHNAAAIDSNVKTFRKVLAQLTLDENAIAQKSGLPARRVAGVYLGWRGASIDVPILKELTFWDRKNTADKVGNGGIAEVLSRLELIQRTRKLTSNRTRLTIVGHSFGGAIVYAALGQILEDRFIRTNGHDGALTDVSGFGDLVVLINPAFEATKFAALSDMSNERVWYPKTQLPVMAVLTSEGDDATRVIFPIGRYFSTVLEKEREVERWNPVTQQIQVIDEGKSNVTTVGHFEPYRTHRLYPLAQVEPRAATDKSLQALSRVADSWQTDAPGRKIPFSQVILERTTNSAGLNPYLVVNVDKKLIHDHNDIDEPVVIGFLKELIQLSTYSAEEKRIMKSTVSLQNDSVLEPY